MFSRIRASEPANRASPRRITASLLGLLRSPPFQAKDVAFIESTKLSQAVSGFPCHFSLGSQSVSECHCPSPEN